MAGNEGDAKSARADLAATNAAVRAGRAFRSRLGDEDSDLEYLARGWAYCSVRPSRRVISASGCTRSDEDTPQVGDFGSAAADMAFAAGLRNPPDPYAAGEEDLQMTKRAARRS